MSLTAEPLAPVTARLPATDVRLDPLGDLDDARLLWERLEGHANPFASWMFADLWWRHVGDDQPLHLHAVRAGGEVIGLLPLYMAAGELRILGHFDADVLGPICAPEHGTVALAALGELVRSARGRLIADELPAGSDAALGGRVTRRTSSPVADLPAAGFDAFLAARSRNLRQTVTNRENRLKRAYDLRIREASERTLEQDVDTLFALHDARWGGTTSTFSGRRMAMHRELAARARERGWLRLRLLELDGRPVAANYAFRVGDAEWYYQSGRDPDYGRASVGFVLLAACIRSACDEGAREYRMLRGDHSYKRSWATRDMPVETVLVEGA